MAKVAAESLADHDVTYLVASPLERAQQTAEPFAARFGLPVATDDRLIESGNAFEGKRVGVGDGALRNPRYWPLVVNPFRPSWGEPYKEVAARMLAALHAARDAAAGHEAVCVSHQLPIVVLRRYLEGRHLWHDPRKRQCALASLTSFRFDGDRLVGIGYSEPAAHLIAMSPGAGDAKGA
jgi:broad specificity phosphatase PhoE